MKIRLSNVLPLLALIAVFVWIGKIFVDYLDAPLVYRSSLTKECAFVDVRGKHIPCAVYTKEELKKFYFGGWV